MLKRFCDICQKEMPPDDPKKPVHQNGVLTRELEQEDKSVLVLSFSMFTKRVTAQGAQETTYDFCQPCVTSIFTKALEKGWLKHDTSGPQHKPLKFS